MSAPDWDPAVYGAFGDLRLRPALDLLARIPTATARVVVDLGCGTGVVAPALAARFSEAAVIGVDPSPAMRAAAVASGGYAAVLDADAASWRPETPPDVLYANAALHWAADHPTLFPRLVSAVAPGGVFAAQMPHMADAPSHALLRRIAHAMAPDRVAAHAAPSVAPPEAYVRWLEPLGAVDVWETMYHQRLAAREDGRHPVGAFTEGAAARPFVEALGRDAPAMLTAYHAALAEPYPLEADGTVLFPFRRLFMVVRRS